MCFSNKSSRPSNYHTVISPGSKEGEKLQITSCAAVSCMFAVKLIKVNKLLRMSHFCRNENCTLSSVLFQFGLFLK